MYHFSLSLSPSFISSNCMEIHCWIPGNWFPGPSPLPRSWCLRLWCPYWGLCSSSLPRLFTLLKFTEVLYQVVWCLGAGKRPRTANNREGMPRGEACSDKGSKLERKKNNKQGNCALPGRSGWLYATFAKRSWSKAKEQNRILRLYWKSFRYRPHYKKER